MQALFSQFVHTVEDHAIFVMDAQARIVDWNIGAQRITGFAASEVLGRTVNEIFTQEDCDAGIPRLERARSLRSSIRRCVCWTWRSIISAMVCR